MPEGMLRFSPQFSPHHMVAPSAGGIEAGLTNSKSRSAKGSRRGVTPTSSLNFAFQDATRIERNTVGIPNGNRGNPNKTILYREGETKLVHVV